MKELTRAEEQVMQYLWRLQRAFLKDIVEQYPEPKPAYTTISTVVNVLVKKEMIGFRTYGKAREYYPKVTKQAYSMFTFRGMMSKFFNDSPSQFASFFAKENDLTLDQLKEVEELIREEIKRKKQ